MTHDAETLLTYAAARPWQAVRDHAERRGDARGGAWSLVRRETCYSHPTLGGGHPCLAIGLRVWSSLLSLQLD